MHKRYFSKNKILHHTTMVEQFDEKSKVIQLKAMNIKINKTYENNYINEFMNVNTFSEGVHN